MNARPKNIYIQILVAICIYYKNITVLSQIRLKIRKIVGNYHFFRMQDAKSYLYFKLKKFAEKTKTRSDPNNAKKY